MNFRKENSSYYIIAGAVILKLIINLVATWHSGFHGDELLHIEAGKHPAFGYMDFPPFITLLAWIQHLLPSGSIFIHHIFNYINASLIMVICGLMTIKTGGKSLAVLIAVSCVLFSPGFGASQYLFLPTAFEQVFWLAFIYMITLFTTTHNNKFLIFAAIIAGFGFLNKYSIVFLFGGFVPAVFFSRPELLKKRTTWIALVVFIAIVLPNLIWQISNHFPVISHFSQLYKTQLDKQSFIKEFIVLIVFLNPFTFATWFFALAVIPFSKKFKDFRLPLFTMLFSFLLFLFAKGKSYYYFPVILGLIPFGAVFFEQFLQSRRIIAYLYLFLLGITGIWLLPHGLPLLSLNKYIELYRLKPNTDNKIPLTFENYYSNENWNRILSAVNHIYNNLPDEDKTKCLVWGRHYSMAGGINLMGKNYNLPPAFSLHSSFYTWVPEFTKDAVIIAISESNWQKPQWERYFNDVNEMFVFENRYASEKNWYNYRIFLCREPKFDSKQLKELFKNEIF